MSIEAIANVVSTNVAASAASRDPVPANLGQAASPPPSDDQPTIAQQDATVTTLSAAALALRATDDQAARDAADPTNVSNLTSVVSRDWAPGAATEAAGVVQDALNALTEASRENLDDAVAAALQTLHDEAALQQKAVDDAAALADQQRDASLLFALNAEIRIAYGALPSSGTGDPVLRDPGQLDVIA